MSGIAALYTRCPYFLQFYPTPAGGARLGTGPPPFTTCVDWPDGGLFASYTGSIVPVIASFVELPLAMVAGLNGACGDPVRGAPDFSAPKVVFFPSRGAICRLRIVDHYEGHISFRQSVLTCPYV